MGFHLLFMIKFPVMHPEFFTVVGWGGGPDPDAEFNLCLICKICYKIMLNVTVITRSNLSR